MRPIFGQANNENTVGIGRIVDIWSGQSTIQYDRDCDQDQCKSCIWASSPRWGRAVQLAAQQEIEEALLRHLRAGAGQLEQAFHAMWMKKAPNAGAARV